MRTSASPAWASTAVEPLLDGPPQDATVLASGRAAAYLSMPDPASAVPMLALLAPGAVRLPIGVVVDEPLPETGSIVRVGGGTIVAGGRAWRPVRWWDPRPRLSAAGLFCHGPRLLALTERLTDGACGLPAPVPLRIAAALAAGHSAPALAATGLGPGLTPAADDVVAGALAALALSDRLSPEAAAAIVERAAVRTTALSAALLAAAVRGEVIPEAATLLRALAAGAGSERLRRALAGLMQVGGTSGPALAAGIAGALAGLPRTQTSLAISGRIS